MKGAEKRMKYYNLSSNIIACDNFLPQQKIDELYTDFLNNREMFNIPSWGNEETETKEFYSEKCGGYDFWIDWNERENSNTFIQSLDRWFLHQGLSHYTHIKSLNIYDWLARPLKWDIHVICYNNGGYYNWHCDKKEGTLFTFNLILNKGNCLKGGDMFFMDDNKIIEVENKNNYMVVFPSFVSHAISPLYSNNKKDVSFLEQRFSVQFWVSFQ